MKKVAFITGSGLYDLSGDFKFLEPYDNVTRFGQTSSRVEKFITDGFNFLHISRHGKNHEFPPHKIPYRANMQKLHDLGVTHIVAFCIVGSLKKEITPGSIVFSDQYVNFTGRCDDFEPFQEFTHLPMATPFSEELRSKLISLIKNDSTRNVVSTGTTVVINGPHFSTNAESLFFVKNGWDIINMTLYPEVYLAREYGIDYVSIGMVTDYNCMVSENNTFANSNYDDVKKVFWSNIEHIKSLIRIICKNHQNVFSIKETCFEKYKEFYRSL